MNEVSIRGKIFTEEEVCNYGKKALSKSKKLFMIISIALLATCVFLVGTAFLSALGGDHVDPETGEITTVAEYLSIIPSAIFMFGVPGTIFLALFIIKCTQKPYNAGIKFLEKRFPAPVDFNGNVIEVLRCDKIVNLSKKPRFEILISSVDKKFQILSGKYYSKILTGKDIIEYEIKIDNEIVITSNTKNKKGVGKALVGGALFGGVGMVAGAVAGNSKSKTTQSQKEIHHYTLALKINDISCPSFVVKLKSLEMAEQATATLDIISQNDNEVETNEKAIEEAVQEVVEKAAPKTFEEVTHKPTKENNLDKFEEIKKYKELLDMGIITQEEFDVQKKRILN